VSFSELILSEKNVGPNILVALVVQYAKLCQVTAPGISYQPVLAWRFN
jgi:hypothetical protein